MARTKQTACKFTGGKAPRKQLVCELSRKDLIIVLEAIRIVAIALSPITPSRSLKIYTQLGYSEDQFSNITWSETRWGWLKQGHVIAQPKPVFSRIDLETELTDTTDDSKKTSKKKDKQKKTQKVVEA